MDRQLLLSFPNCPGESGGEPPHRMAALFLVTFLTVLSQGYDSEDKRTSMYSHQESGQVIVVKGSTSPR